MNKDLIISNAIRFINDHVIECDFNTGCGKCDEARVIKQSLQSLLQEQEKEPKIDIEFFRANILRHLSTEDMITLRNWLNSYESVSQSGEEITEEIKDINFIKWYSGMEEQKIRNAFKRYQKEVLNQK